MGMAEERLRVLQMIQSGQVTAEEGARLLEAIKGKKHLGESGPGSRVKGLQQIRIQVTDLETGRQKIDVRMPWNLINVGISMGARFARKEVEVNDFVEAIQADTEGKIMDVVDEEGGERVEVFVE